MPFYIGLLAPFVIVYVFNWIIFALIMIQFFKKNCRTKFQESSTKDRHMSLKQQFMIAVTLSLLFGLGWGIGLFATQEIETEEVRNLFAALFIVLTGFQGLFIFIMHCVRSKEVRKEWKTWFYRVSGKNMSELSRSSVSSSYWQKRRMNKMQASSVTEVSYISSGTLKKNVESAFKVSPGTIQLGVFDDLPKDTVEEIESKLNKDIPNSPEPEYDSTRVYRLPSVAQYDDIKNFRSSQLTIASNASGNKSYGNPVEEDADDDAESQLKDVEKALESSRSPPPFSPFSEGITSPDNFAYYPNPLNESEEKDGVCNAGLDATSNLENQS